ncbi:MAG: 4-alpha-glucanotransferase [Cyanobacteria bacterium SZAS LIN-2]|nr:4-alpha-glucanotransferase [Cyanobacteria bacterium SZAS LIN-3]MBS1995301.1 4-alpha-glucanotransferase [Cyanobacteria bacterium SZAS LIN-2]MBS2005900.1 4-alpha-glucanotransferase [Cyanobacteria bacterium SZAS TMP-1]
MAKKIDATKKIAGLLIPVFALRGPSDLGIGDIKCVIDAIDFFARHKLKVFQVLPVNETGPDNSPYNAISSIALDPVYISLLPDMVPGLTSAMVNEFAPPDVVRGLSQGPVQYALVKDLKLKILFQAFLAFDKLKTSANEDFSAFLESEKDWLDDYALFRSLIDEEGGNVCWTYWRKDYQSPDAARKVIAAAAEDDRKRLEEKIRFYKFVQWVAFSQWRKVRSYADEKGVELMGDIPFGVSRYSADVWGKGHLFEMKWSGGAPPERFFQSDEFTRKWGQNWGIPVYKWDAHRKENFAFWRSRVKHVADIFHYFRIDHVLGFFRVYAFPWLPERNGEFVELTEEEAEELTGGELPRFIPRDDETPKNCKLNCAEGSEYLKVILEAAGDHCGVVAEDLGMVPDYVRPRLKELGIPGFTIPIFERNEKDRSFKTRSQHEVLSLVTLGTHDHEPIKTFYEGLCRWWHGENGHEGWLEVQRLMQFLELPRDQDPPTEFTPELHKRFIEILMECRPWLAVFMISDLLGQSQRFNEPGIAGDSNWSQRLSLPLADYEKEKPFSDAIHWLDQAMAETGRGAALAKASN